MLIFVNSMQLCKKTEIKEMILYAMQKDADSNKILNELLSYHEIFFTLQNQNYYKTLNALCLTT